MKVAQKPIIKAINIMASPTVDISDKEKTIKAFLSEYRIKEWKPEYTAVVLEYKHLPKSALIKLLQRCYPDYPFKKSASYMYITEVLKNNDAGH